MTSEWFRITSYLIYLVFWEMLTLGGAGYAVFVLGASGWWFALAAVMAGCPWTPERWSTLWDEKLAEKFRQERKAKTCTCI